MLKKSFIVFYKGFSTDHTLSLFSTSVILSFFQNDTQLKFWIKLFSTGCFETEFSSSESKIYPLQDPLFIDMFFSFVLMIQSLLFNAHYRQCLDSQSHYILDRLKNAVKKYWNILFKWVLNMKKLTYNITRSCFSYSTF